MTAPLLGFARAVDLAQRDLKAIGDRLEVVHTEAWCPARPDRDRPTPPRPPSLDPDAVPGERWDCGQGSHKARKAWSAMTGHLTDAEAQIEQAMGLLRGCEPACVPVCRPTSLLDAQTAIRRLQTRLRGVEGIHAGLDVPRGLWLGRALMGERGHPQFSACWHVEMARYEALSIVAIVGTGRKPPTCSDCKRAGSVGQPRKGGRCDACHQRKWRLESRQRRAAVRSKRAA